MQRFMRRSRLFCTQLEALIVTKSAAKRLQELSKVASEPLWLRIAVEGGGCSGFSYKYELEKETILAHDDVCFEKDGSKVIVDTTSLELIHGSTIDFVQELIRSSFAIINNPHAESGCGCGVSFSLKE